MSDHDALISVAARWERMYGELFVKAQRLSDTVVERDTQIAALKTALEEQWHRNHYEICADDWPHEGDCYWERPSVLAAVSSPGATERPPLDSVAWLLFDEGKANRPSPGATEAGEP